MINDLQIQSSRHSFRGTNVWRNAPYALLWLFVFTIPWENFVVFPGIGTLSRVVGISMAVVGGASVLLNGKMRISWLLSATLFIAWTLASGLWSGDVSRSVKEAFTFSQLFVFSWMVTQLIRCRNDFDALLRAYVYGAYVSVIDTIRVFILYSDTNRYRFVASGFNANYLAYTLVLGIPIAAYLLFRRFERGSRGLLLLAYPFLASIAIVLTGSRGALIALIVSLCYVAYLMTRNFLKGIVVGALTVGLAVTLIASFVPDRTLDRLAGTYTEITTGTLSNRPTIWKAGLEKFIEVPWHGVGAGSYSDIAEQSLGRARTAHNVFVSIITETGIIGLVLFGFTLINALFSAAKMGRDERMLFLFLFLVLFIIFMAATWQSQKPTWFLIGLSFLPRYLFVPEPGGRNYMLDLEHSH